jgi:aminomethyltransferase
MTTSPSAVDGPLKRLPLEAQHEALGARFAPFAGWRMPLQYPTGTVDEHRAVREALGVFDVTHMGRFFVSGPDAVAAVDRIVTNDIAALPVGKAAYTVMCDPTGGIIDDLIVYKLAPQRLMIIVNAGTCAGDRAHFEAHLSGDLTFQDRSDDFVLLAVQGPRAAAAVQALCVDDLSGVPTYGVMETASAQHGGPLIAARTGYTGEDGFELLSPTAAASPTFDALLRVGQPLGLKPIGLAARDTLRLEARYPLYSQDITRDTNPLEAGLGWVVKLQKPSDFIGRDALRAIQAVGLSRRLIGVVMTERGVLRPGYPLFADDQPIGALTSGSISVTLGYAIGLGYVTAAAATEATAASPARAPAFSVEIRGKRLPVTLTTKPFYRRPQ